MEGKGSYCVEHLSGNRDQKKKKGFIAAMRNSGQSPDCGHSNHGCHRLTVIAIPGDEQEKLFSLVFLLAFWQGEIVSELLADACGARLMASNSRSAAGWLYGLW